MAERDEVMDDEEVLAQEEVVVQGKESWLANSPWWLVSAGIHAVLLLGASLYAIDKLVPVDQTVYYPEPAAQKPPVIEEQPLPRDVFARKGIPKDEASFATGAPFLIDGGLVARLP